MSIQLTVIEKKKHRSGLGTADGRTSFPTYHPDALLSVRQYACAFGLWKMLRLVVWNSQWRGLGMVVPFLRRCWARAELNIVQALGLHQPWDPALAVQAPVTIPELALDDSEMDEAPSFLDSIFWLGGTAPKKRRTIEVNRCRRRNPNKLIKVKHNIDVCPECGHLKQKHILCGVCYEKVRLETAKIRGQIKALEGGPFKAATVETLVLYEGEKSSEEDQGKRIIERPRKRPPWFTLHI